MFFTRTTFAEKTGHALKHVCCEKCGAKFHYAVKRKGIANDVTILGFGAEVSTWRAETAAHKELSRALEKAVDLVACPACGWFQAHMISAKRRKLVWILIFVTLLLPWPTVVVCAVALKDIIPRTKLVDTLIWATVVEWAGLGLLGLLLFFSFRPNAGVFLPFSRKNVNHGLMD